MNIRQKASLAALFERLADLAKHIDESPDRARELGKGTASPETVIAAYLSSTSTNAASELRGLLALARQSFPNISALTKKAA
jgi:hypothetical protein